MCAWVHQAKKVLRITSIDSGAPSACASSPLEHKIINCIKGHVRDATRTSIFTFARDRCLASSFFFFFFFSLDNHGDGRELSRNENKQTAGDLGVT